MDMHTTADIDTAKKLVADLAAPLRETGALRIWATVENKQGPRAVVHSPYIGSAIVTSIAEGVEHARKSESARKQGRLPRELRVAI